MTKIEKAVLSIVALLITVSITVTLIISIFMCSKNNQDTYELMASVGVSVLKDDIELKMDDMETTFQNWINQSQLKSALKNGYVGTLAEVYTNANLDENVFCMFTDGQGNIVWKSDNYKLLTYDVSSPLSFDSSKHVEFDSAIDEDYNVKGLYSDENVPLSCIFTAPVVFGNTTLVGTCFMGYDLSSQSYLNEIKEQTGNDISIYSGKSAISSTLSVEELSETLAMSGDIYDDLMAGEVFSGSTTFENQEYFSYFEPVYDIYGNFTGAYYAGQSSEQSDASFTQIIIVSAIAAIVIIVIAIVVVGLFLKNVISKPIVALSEIADKMSHGNLDFPDNSEEMGKTELAQFAKDLQKTRRRLAGYITDITKILTAMANGDFTVSPSVIYHGDFVAISESFEMIRTRLRDIVQSIEVSSDQVLNGSAQMASGSQVLADGTTTQASAVEKLNSTVVEISQKIEVNADNALRAKELSAGVEASAVEQNSDMTNVISAMHDIEEKSSEISSIIKTIDDIAFQTNILALNASVEAARAGEAGKGFSVVAGEVRNLATKSAEAANRTGELISATVEAVKDGTMRVNAAAESMLEITRKAKETSLLIDGISEASAEQAIAIREVTAGIEQIADVVQENSATAEQTAASCEQLNGQSQVLRNQVSKLKA